MKIFIIGNAGSGKSYLARHLSHKNDYPILHLDHISFAKKHYKSFINFEERLRAVKEFMSVNDNLIIEGVYDDIFLEISAQIDMLIYLDIPWQEAKKGLESRKYDPIMTDILHHNSTKKEFINYCKNYYTQENDIVKDNHDNLFSNFKKDKIKLSSRKSVRDYINTYKKD